MSLLDRFRRGGDLLALGRRDDDRPPPELMAMARALADVASERSRQIEAEGFAPDHDDLFNPKEQLAAAAVCYAMPEEDRDILSEPMPTPGCVPVYWPWAPEWWKPGDRRRDLVKAAALLVAAIEQIDRRRDRQLHAEEVAQP